MSLDVGKTLGYSGPDEDTHTQRRAGRPSRHPRKQSLQHSGTDPEARARAPHDAQILGHNLFE